MASLRVVNKSASRQIDKQPAVKVNSWVEGHDAPQDKKGSLALALVKQSDSLMDRVEEGKIEESPIGQEEYYDDSFFRMTAEDELEEVIVSGSPCDFRQIG